MTKKSWRCIGLLMMATAGCGEAARAPDSIDVENEDEPSPSKPDEAPPPSPGLPRRSTVLTWTSDGHLAVVEGESGTIRQRCATAGLGGARDLIYDPWQSRAVVFEGEPSGKSGEIALHWVKESAL